MLCPFVGGILIIVFSPGNARETIIPRYECDHEVNTFMEEGNQGLVGKFPWLGVIRVTLNEGSKLRIAITGAVLIRITFAIANAEDVVKIPKRILKDYSKVMFISSEDSPWLYAIRDFVPHPEFRHSTMSSIALVELQVKDNPTPLTPICWINHVYDISYKHYAMGFTDENYLLEKVAYNMQFVNKSHCDSYYASLDMHDSKYVPVYYHCWAAMSNARDCVWENGMVLVSNYSGTWVLVGMGLRGPGCGLPVRFISVYPYLAWIESMIDEAAVRINSEQLKLRVKERTAHSFFKNNEEVEEFHVVGNIREFNKIRTTLPTPPNQGHNGTRPEHDGVASDYDGRSNRRQGPNKKGPNEAVETTTVVEKPREQGSKYYADEHWKRDDIRHMDPNVINIVRFGNKYERSRGDCTRSKYLCYKEITEVKKTPNMIGQASYKLSLVELEKYRYTCIVIRVKSLTRSDCHLWYSIAKVMDEPLAMLDDTPEEILKHYIPIGERSTTGPAETDPVFRKPHQNLEVFYKKNEDPWTPRWWTNLTMLNLFIKFDFVDDAELVLEVWGPYSESVYKEFATTDRASMINRTRTRLRGHNVTRSRKPSTYSTTVKTKRTRTKPESPKKREIYKKYAMIEATGTKSHKRYKKRGSNGSNYLGMSGLWVIVIIINVLFDDLIIFEFQRK